MGFGSGGFSRMTSSMALLLVWVTMSLSACSGSTLSDHKAVRKSLCYHSPHGNRTIYDYKIADVHGQKPIDWTNYRGKVVLVVNVASF
jgi:hypothetical protein